MSGKAVTATQGQCESSTCRIAEPEIIAGAGGTISPFTFPRCFLYARRRKHERREPRKDSAEEAYLDGSSSTRAHDTGIRRPRRLACACGYRNPGRPAPSLLRRGASSAPAVLENRRLPSGRVCRSVVWDVESGGETAREVEARWRWEREEQKPVICIRKQIHM